MSIRKLLIANRGEIAVRIIKTAKRMGITTIAIKTSSEPNALYISYADIVYDCTRESPETSVFLDIEKLITIAILTKADAIHPGYGFLAENPSFAQQCINHEIIFVGPSPDTIYNMGNKIIARKIARENNIPTTMGSDGNVDNYEKALEIAEEIGYPVIIKASSGGGGRGMRIVRKAKEMSHYFQQAQNEAMQAFNDASVFIEKYIENPKHIEFQILGDKFGNIVQLGERECSIQRKNQKLFEESPSPALNDKLRRQMADAAVTMAKSVHYCSAGTIEFLLDSKKNFYFMEMNTRIQVEHTVTEMVTNIDLVEQQIRIADERPIHLKQWQISTYGWAMECRINAEDVQAGFAPCSGRIESLSFPDGGNIRIDTGICKGSTIDTSFDSMIAKLIVVADDRQGAINETLNALNKVWITGVKTTLPFFKMLMKNETFISGDFTTSFVEKELTKYYEESDEEEMLAAWFAVSLFANENLNFHNTNVDYEKGKELSPWLKNRRLNQFNK